MLGLSTHEAHFYLIRERIPNNFEKKCDTCGEMGHFASDCKIDKSTITKKIHEMAEFSYIKLNVIREYLDKEVRLIKLTF
jgi:5'-3' exoribonuclease 2